MADIDVNIKLSDLALEILAKLTSLNTAKLKELFTDEELASVLGPAFAGIKEPGTNLQAVLKSFFSNERTAGGLQQVFGGDSDKMDFSLLERIFIDICNEKHVETAGFDFFEAISRVFNELEILLKKDKKLAKKFNFPDMDSIYNKLKKGGIIADADRNQVLFIYHAKLYIDSQHLQLPWVHSSKISLSGPLPSVFVMPRVKYGSRSVAFDHVFQEREGQRITLLGKPGAGKTTLMKFILFKSLENSGHQWDSDSAELPILVEIPKLGRTIINKNPGYGIVDYFYDSTRDDYKRKPPDGFFEKYLDSGRALVVFDGLDEVLDEGRRAVVRDMIVDFSTSFRGKNTIIVTSRIVGYERTPFPTEEYLHLTLEDFNDEEFDRVFLNWFQYLSKSSLEEEGKLEELKNLITARTSIKELARIPVLLAYTCHDFLDNVIISKDILTFYNDFTEIMLSTWDIHKNIIDDEFKLKDRRRYLEKIAFQIQSFKEKKGDMLISRSELDDLLIPDFKENFSCDNHTAKSMVGDFLEKIGARTGIFVEVEPGMYGFVYTAFREYFAARWIMNDVRLGHSKKQMIDYIDEYIGDESWHEILILSLIALPRESGRIVLNQVLSKWKIPHFYVKSITVENVKCFKGKHFLNLSHVGKHANWTVILGNNGTGKTTLLQSIASLDTLRLKTNAKFVNVDKQEQEFEITCRETKESPTRGITGKIHYRLQDNSPYTKFMVDNIDMIYEHFYDWLKTSGLFSLSVYAYGASRKSGEAVLTGSSSGDRHANLFEEKDLMNAEEWLVQADYAARKGTGNGAEFKLGKIKKILLDILPDVKGFEFKTTDDLRNYVEFLTDYGNVRFKDLSLGYRVMISWVVDLARQMFERYPSSNDPLAEPAVVLVDEIDLHLHPSWQRNIIHYLSQYFKKTQFIVTAHSPLIVQSSEPITVVLLNKDAAKGSVSISNEVNASYSGWTIEEILSDLMGLEKTDSDKYLQLTEEFQKAVSGENLAAAKKVYDKLDKILHPGNHLRKLMRIQMATLGGEES